MIKFCFCQQIYIFFAKFLTMLLEYTNRFKITALPKWFNRCYHGSVPTAVRYREQTVQLSNANLVEMIYFNEIRMRQNLVTNN